MGRRTCWIMTASIEDDEGSDGEYDLHGMHGTPEEIGRAIAKSLAEVALHVFEARRPACTFLIPPR